MISNFANQTSIKVNNHHHPILLLNIGDVSDVSQKVACKNNEEMQISINFANKVSKWKFPYFVSSMDLEKYRIISSIKEKTIKHFW